VLVHVFGQIAPLEEIQRLAPGVPVIEDAAQSIGARRKIGGEWRMAGECATIGTFSFFPSNNLGGYGDGGMLTTEDDALAAKLRILRVHGMEPKYYHQVVGINSRLDSIQAAVLNVKLPHLEAWIAARQMIAARYQTLFAERGLQELITLPAIQGDSRHVWNQFVVRVAHGQRDALRQHLAERKIGSEIYYPVPIHAQTCFQTLPHRCGELTVTNQAALETLALPIFPELTELEQRYVVDEITVFWQARAGTTTATLAGPKYLQRGNETAHK